MLIQTDDLRCYYNILLLHWIEMQELQISHISQIRQNSQDVGNTIQEQKQMKFTWIMLRQKSQIQNIQYSAQLVVDLIFIVHVLQISLQTLTEAKVTNQNQTIVKQIKDKIQKMLNNCLFYSAQLIIGFDFKLVLLVFRTNESKNRAYEQLYKKIPKQKVYSKISQAHGYKQKQLLQYYMQTSVSSVGRLLNIPNQFTNRNYLSMGQLRLLVKLLKNYEESNLSAALHVFPLLNQFYRFRNTTKVQRILKHINQYQKDFIYIDIDTIVQCYQYVIYYIPFLIDLSYQNL